MLIQTDFSLFSLSSSTTTTLPQGLPGAWEPTSNTSLGTSGSQLAAVPVMPPSGEADCQSIAGRDLVYQTLGWQC